MKLIQLSGQRRAMTLIELVITISLTAIIGVAMGTILSQQLGGAIRSRDVTVAMNLVRREMERLDALNDFFVGELSVSCPSGATVTTPLPSYFGYSYDLSRQVSCVLGNCCSTANSSHGIKRIQVTATKTGSTTPLARLVTYRTKHVQFGS